MVVHSDGILPGKWNKVLSWSTKQVPNNSDNDVFFSEIPTLDHIKQYKKGRKLINIIMHIISNIFKKKYFK